MIWRYGYLHAREAEAEEEADSDAGAEVEADAGFYEEWKRWSWVEVACMHQYHVQKCYLPPCETCFLDHLHCMVSFFFLSLGRTALVHKKFRSAVSDESNFFSLICDVY